MNGRCSTTVCRVVSTEAWIFISATIADFGTPPRPTGKPRPAFGTPEGGQHWTLMAKRTELHFEQMLIGALSRDRCVAGNDPHTDLSLPKAEWQVVEAQALVHTLDGWSVVDTMVVPTKTPGRKLIFGRGTLEHLTEKIRGSPEITAVFLNVERMAAPTKKELEAAWGVRVFDRFTVVLHIFRCNARTKEARLQVALAELPLLRSHLKNDVAHLGGRGGGSRHIMGSGESFLQVHQRLLKDKEAKIRKALDKLRRKRLLLGQQRRRREFPVVSVVGYTNCGKTTLIKALTGDAAIQPRDRLFATLDVTAHAGWLPSRL
ncbi:hypothetical protein E2I00_016610, partial [Balaenoptera physalus]